MFLLLSKLLPLFIYPLGLACGLLVVGVLAQKRPNFQRSLLLFALLLLWLGGNRWVATGLVRSLEKQFVPIGELPTADVIVVLGGGTRHNHPPRPMVELNEAGDRVLYTFWLYNQGKADHILLSGGGGKLLTAETPDGEAHDMSAVLTMLGIPAQAIWLEPNSLNTYENARNSRMILAEKGVNRILLVTSAIHMPRAVALFEEQGLEVIPAPTDFLVSDADIAYLWQASWPIQLTNLLPNATYLEWTTRALKEYIGVVVYKLRGWM